MKKILIIGLILMSIQIQAQNSDLWNKVQEIRNQHFQSTAHIPLGTVKEVTMWGRTDLRDTIRRTWKEYKGMTPYIMLDDMPIANIDPSGVQMSLDTLNKYNLYNMEGFNYYKEGENSIYNFENRGTIYIYSRTFIRNNPQVKRKLKILVPLPDPWRTNGNEKRSR